MDDKSTPPTASSLDRLAASVWWLKTGFMDEVRSAGLDESSRIYEIENLDGSPGVIRTKGANRTSPTDGRPGAAYVHCLDGEDNVGTADFMLSYSWGYKIGDIVDTLDSHCDAEGVDPKRTYVWICCLCVNQHRVVEQKSSKSGMLAAPTVDFFAEFRERVVGIGDVLSMMSPWHEPLYLKRIWCIFEIYTASQQEGCRVTILMPPAEKKAVEEALVGEGGELDRLYEALARTKVQDAKASEEQDRVAILDMVKRRPGCGALNNWVNERLRRWVRGVIDEAVEARSTDGVGQDKDTDLAFADFCSRVGQLLNRNGELDKSLEMFRKSLAIRETVLGEDHPDTAMLHNNIGIVLDDKGDYDGALEEHRKALAIRKTVLGEDHPHTAGSHNNIGNVLNNKGDYDGALGEHRKALAIRKTMLGEDHPYTAMSHNNIGIVLRNKGDNDGALGEHRKALAIRKTVLGEDHPDTADSHNNIGAMLANKGDYDGALGEHRKALAIRETVLGEDHPSTAMSHNNIGNVLADKGDFDGALGEYRKALAIKETVLGADHPSTSRTQNNIRVLLRDKGDVKKAASCTIL